MTSALLFFLCIIFATIKAADQVRLTAMALDLLATGYTDPNPPFERLHDDVYCKDGGTNRLFARTNIQMKDCKAECSDNDACKYFAFWIKSKKCEGYETCEIQASDGKNKIAVYVKVSPCEMLLPSYVDSMVTQFKPHTLRPLHLPFEWQKSLVPRSAYPNPNFFCKCIGTIWMICPIFLPNSGEDFDAVGLKLDVTDLEKMKPFFLLNTDLNQYGGESAFLAFLEPPPRTIAEIEIIDHLMYGNEEVAGCIQMHQCAEGTPNGREPITGRLFKSGDAVWILLRDYPKVQMGRPVGCISAKGIRTWVLRESSQREGGFIDPLGRVDPSQPLTLDEHFVMLIVFDRDALLTGICGKSFMEEASEQNQLEVEDQAPEVEKLSDVLESLSTGKKKKKKKKGKGASSSAAADSSSSLSAGSPQPSLLGMLEGSNSPLQGDSPDYMQSASEAIQAPQLSQADLQKMRKSFEEAKARRASGKAPEERVATIYGSLSMIHFVYIAIALLLMFLFWISKAKKSEQDVYIIF